MDLLNLEKETAKKMAGRKILYKQEYLDSLASAEHNQKIAINSNIKPNQKFIKEKVFMTNYGFSSPREHKKKTTIKTIE